MCEKEQKQKQPENGLQANWANDGTHIGGNYKMHKLEFLVLIVCILLAIICGTFLYATFFSANSSNPEPNGQQNNGHLHKEIETLRNQIGQMAEETKMQKALEKLQNHTIVDLLAMIGQLLDETNGQKALVKLQNETIHELRAKIEQQAEVIGQMVYEAIGQKSMETSLNKTIDDLHAKVEQQTKECAGHLNNKEIEALRSQIGQMAEEARAQKALEKVHLQTIDELRAMVKKQQAKEQAEAAILQKKLYNMKGNRWKKSNRNVTISRGGLNLGNTTERRPHVFAEQGFDISGDSRKEDNFTGTIIYYFEVTQMSHARDGQYYIGLSDGSIPADGKDVGDYANSYGSFYSSSDIYWIAGKKHDFEWPVGTTKPEWNKSSIGDVVTGCGLLLNADNKLAIFFTLNGTLLGKLIQINPSVHHLYPTVTMLQPWFSSYTHFSLEANFGDNPAKPFCFDIAKCPQLIYPQILSNIE